MERTFHNDPGHGWLEAPITDLETLGIAHMISPYSYVSRDGSTIYLEEDCDASVYMKAAEIKGWTLTTVDRHYRWDAPMRTMNLYLHPDYDLEAWKQYPYGAA